MEEHLIEVGDKGYDSDKAREHMRARDIGACIPPKRNRLVQHWYDTELYCTWSRTRLTA
jgi:hypothetical protein